MKNIVLIGLLLIATGAVITTGFTRRSIVKLQNTKSRFNVKDLPEHGLSIIDSSDSRYGTLVSSLLQDNSDPLVETLAPFSIFIKNSSKHTVVACVLKWEMIPQNGKTLTSRREYTNLLVLMGKEVSGVKEGLIIRPGGTWFFTPSYLPVSQGEDRSKTVNDKTEVVAELNRVLPELTQFTSITVSLDGAFFDDGTFVGPDSSEFFAKVEAMRNGRRDALLAIVNDKKEGKSDIEVFKHVEELAAAKVNTNARPTAADYYSSFRKDAAAELLRMRKAEGDAKTLGRVHQKLQKPWPELRKL